MPVFRVEKNSNYTTMCNYHLRDQGLSLKGKGLLSMLLSLPDTWNYSVRGLSSITPDGVDGVLTALKELERLGYLERNQQRESNGRMGRAEYVIYEMPRKKPCSESPCTENPYTVNPDTDTPVTENPAQLSTNRTSTETINKREKKEIQHRYLALLSAFPSRRWPLFSSREPPASENVENTLVCFAKQHTPWHLKELQKSPCHNPELGKERKAEV